MSSSTNKSRVRKTTCWLVIALGLLLSIPMLVMPSLGGEKTSLSGALWIPVLFLATGIYYLDGRKIAGVLLVLAGVAWGWSEFLAAHGPDMPISEMIGRSALPLLMASVGLYFLWKERQKKPRG